MTDSSSRVADSPPSLLSVTLGGFQVFEEVTTIPLGRLTFLFGPNSAGKSAVEDALLLLRECLKEETFGEPDDSRLERHWRRIDSQSSVFAPEMTLGVTAWVDVHLPGCLGGSIHESYEGSYDSGSTRGHEIGAKFRFGLNKEDITDSGLVGKKEFLLSVDGEPIVKIEEGLRIGADLRHPIIRKSEISAAADALISRFPETISVSDGWIWLKSDWRLKFATNGDYLRRDFGVPDYDQNVTDQTSQQVPANADPLHELLDFFPGIMQSAIGNMCYSPDIVSASRKIPGRSDVTHVHETETEDSLLGHLHLSSKSDWLLRELAESCLEERLGAERTAWGPPGPELFQLVNRAIGDRLFPEHGYQIRAHFRLILDLDDFTQLYFPEPGEAIHCPAVTHLYLVDAKGRSFSFDEVGSGLGYVLPVLCSIFRQQTSVSLVQQPELHLHPALQATMGDVLITAVDSNHQVVAETHSEHLLLRVLKRIRQTTKGTIPSEDLQIVPEDVVVAYFEPMPDGTTTVNRLRISEEGEFLDRWPRGFFTERDEELFDE